MRFSTIVCLILFSSIALCQTQKSELLSTCNPQATKKILVTYATVAGSTEEVAIRIKDQLCKAGLQVSIAEVSQVKSTKEYQGVVIGSGIYAGHWIKSADEFLKKNKEELKTKKIAYFFLCLLLKDDTPENRKKVAEYLKDERELITPISEGHFAGKGDSSKLSFTQRQFAKMMKMPEGDFRNWKAIESWAQELAKKF